MVILLMSARVSPTLVSWIRILLAEVESVKGLLEQLKLQRAIG